MEETKWEVEAAKEVKGEKEKHVEGRKGDKSESEDSERKRRKQKEVKCSEGNGTRGLLTDGPAVAVAVGWVSHPRPHHPPPPHR